jgi:S-adenosylmethionine/arginine decarboxylase-like enzyme
MFGKILMLDLYKCKKGVCDDLELHYRFLEELVERLGMQKLCQPVCLHAPVRFENGKRIEIYPEKTGVSAWIGLITSGIQVHSCEESGFCSIDVYTCGELDVEKVVEFCKEIFQPEDLDSSMMNRGIRYCVPQTGN